MHVVGLDESYAYVEVCACVCVHVYVYIEKKNAVACAVKLKIDCPLESQSCDERWCDKHKYREFCLVLFIKIYVLAGVKIWPVELKNQTMIELKISE